MDNFTPLFDRTVDAYKRHAGEVAMRRLPRFVSDLYHLYRAMGWDSWDESKYLHLFEKE